MSKKEQRGFSQSRLLVLIAGVIIVFGIVGAGAYWQGTRNSKLLSQGASTVSPFPLSSGWKRYQDRENFFIIDYPQSWNTVGSVAGPYHYFSNENYGMNLGLTQNGVLVIIQFTDAESWNKLFTSDPGVITNQQGQLLTKISDLTINGYPAVKYTQQMQESGSTSIYETIYLIKSKNVVALIQFQTNSRIPMEKNAMIFDQMATSFRFLKQPFLPLIPSSSTSETVTQAYDTVDTVIQKYYSWYLDCLQQHFANNSNHSPQEDCPYNKTDVLPHNKTSALTDYLLTRLRQVKGSDPVLCAQNIPQSVTFEKAIDAYNGTATGVVHTLWGASSPHDIKLELQEINHEWKIASITCTP